MAKYDYDIEANATQLIKDEKTAWEDGTAFITDRVSFNIRNLIKQLRKNYWGVFDKPFDPQTGREKIWIPLTQHMVEACVKSIDLDTKDINFRAKKPESVELTTLIRSIVKNELDLINFGETLDDIERAMSIDGTAIICTDERWSPELKRKILDVRRVDRLNFYIDPTARSIYETEAVIERLVIPYSQFKKVSGEEKWINTDKVEPVKNINRYDANTTTNEINTRMVEIYRRRGKMPLSIITGKKKDEDTEIDGEIIASANEGRWIFHSAEKRKSQDKGYEEAWYTRVPNRWDGRGVAESVMMLQLWLNIIVNIRINRSYVSQLGLFKIRKGSGITPQMLSKLQANGAVEVNDINDIEQMVVQEASQASYTDEENIKQWAERVTSAFQVVTGETLPASTTATVGAIQTNNAASSFVLIKEALGMFLQRWVKRQVFPFISKMYKRGDIIRYIDDQEEMRALDKRKAEAFALEELAKSYERGGIMGINEYLALKDQKFTELQSEGQDRFDSIKEDINYSDFDVQVYVTNEEIDKNVLVQNLMTALPLAPEYKNQIMDKIFDLMGLDLKKPEIPMMGQPMGQQGQIEAPQQTPQEPQTVMQNANVPGFNTQVV